MARGEEVMPADFLAPPKKLSDVVGWRAECIKDGMKPDAPLIIANTDRIVAVGTHFILQ